MNIKIGNTTSIKKVFTKEEVIRYATSSMDENPVHFDENYASKTFFKKPIVHGLFAASLFGGLLGSKLPGRGTIQLGQELKFIKPVFVGEAVTALIEVVAIREDKPIITFNCVLIKEDTSIAIEGKAVVMYKGEVFIK
jgi:acyl dehydratase